MANPRYFAVLIGINFYAQKPLKGSVRDVDLIQQYLTAAKLEGKINLFQIFRHTASNPTEASGAQPPEEPSSLPTLQNVRKSLSHVTTVAENGDFVYIHFSGHGTEQQGSFGLVLLNDELGQPSYIFGPEIAEILCTMVEKKLKVLLVLDCCFSGRVDRHGDAGNCRFIECDPTINLPNYRLHDSLIETTYTSVNPSTFRDASTCMNWVVDPKGYTVLTACGPTEQSFELRIGNNARHGILSYFFVRTLRKLGELKMSHLVIFQFVCAMFRACLAKQTPQLKGNGDLRFFGHLESSVDMIFPVIKLRNGRLRIQAGEIFGVQEREELVLSPLNVLRNEDPAKASVTAVAQHTGGVETDLELADSTFDSSQIDATWVARPLRWLQDAENPYLGSVTGNYNDNPLEHQVNIENQQASNGLIPPGLTPATAPFKAVVNSQGQFEIRNRADEKVEFDSISLLSPQSKDSRGLVCRLLSHLTRFDEITNVKPRHEDVALRDEIDITLSKSQGRSSLKPGLEFIEARDGESIRISVANKSKIRAYVHMFCLGVGTWEISNLLAAENTELSADPVELKIQMEVPDCQIVRGIRQSEDIIKIFVTTRSAPFANMVMSMPVFRFAEDEALDSWLVHTFRIRTSKC